MPKFGKKSKLRLLTCDYRLQEVFKEVIKKVDCSVLEGHRNEERQNKLFKEGKLKLLTQKVGIMLSLLALLTLCLTLWTGRIENASTFLLGAALGWLVGWVYLFAGEETGI